MVRLGVNVDHIATIRNARGELFPSVLEAALIAETHGADLITAHLREDRRHIKDNDIIELRKNIKTQLNLEMAATDVMVDFALQVKPDFVCLVPEKRQELTTEGGLNVADNLEYLTKVITILQEQNIRVSLFIDADERQIKASVAAKAYAIELHTGAYAEGKDSHQTNPHFHAIEKMTQLAHSLGLIVNAGHGLNYHNVMPIAKLQYMHELNIGFAIIAKSVFVGLATAVSEMKRLINVIV